MLIVALTGGIGSGKTMVGEIFAELGALVVDSDQLAREVVERGSKGFDLIVTEFGDEILKNGDLDRTALATLIFQDPKKRAKLEEITHPLIRQSFAKIISSADSDSIIINQIPLLVESKHDYKFDHIINISVPEEIRTERLLKRGLTLTQIDQRMKAQATDAQREVISDTVIVNDKSEQELITQVEKVWESLKNKSMSK
jgi:dephospho-CoA kinase